VHASNVSITNALHESCGYFTALPRSYLRRIAKKWAKCSRSTVTDNLYRSEIISDSRFDAPVREPPSPRILSAAPRAAQDSVPEVPRVWSGWRSSDGGRA